MGENATTAPASPDSSLPFRNYVEAILEVLAGDPGRTVITDADGLRMTAGTLHDSVYRAAAELAERGAGRGSTLALLSGNRPEALVARYAANLLGARVAFLHEVIHTQIAPDVVAHIGQSVDSIMWLIDPALRQLAENLLSLPDLPPVLFLGPSPLGEDLTTWLPARHTGRGARERRTPRGRLVHPDDRRNQSIRWPR